MTNLRSVRIAQGYSLRALAKKMDCASYNAIHTWERGRNRPHPGNAKRLQDVLGVPLEILLAPVHEKAPRLEESKGFQPSQSVQEPRRNGDHPQAAKTSEREAYYV